MNEKRKKDDQSFFAAMALVGQLGLYIALPMVFGAIGGRYLDTTFFRSSLPIATLLGLLLGLVAGISLVVRAVSRLTE